MPSPVTLVNEKKNILPFPQTIIIKTKPALKIMSFPVKLTHLLTPPYPLSLLVSLYAFAIVVDLVL